MKLARSTKDVKLVVGGDPRIRLLPPEVAARASAKSTRRAFVGVVILSALIAGGGFGYAVVGAEASQQRLADAQAETSALLVKQQKYSEVDQVAAQLDAAKTAQRVGVSTEIDWKDYLGKVTGVLPEGVTITTVAYEGATPMSSYEQASAPLQGERMGSLAFTATTISVPDVSEWLDGLATLPGFVDAAPGSISTDETGYTTTIVVHVNADAFSGRFAADVDANEEGDSQ